MPCRLCGCTTASIYHLLIDCPRITHTRDQLLDGLHDLVGDLMRLTEEAIRADGGPPLPPSDALLAWLATPLRLNTTQNGFMAYWLLLAVPWPRFITEPDPLGEF